MSSTLNTFLTSSSTNGIKSFQDIKSPLEIISAIEQDKFFLSIVGLIVFLMGRSLYTEMYETCSRMEILDSSHTKKLTLWCVLFLYSRSIIHSSILAVIIIILFPDIFLSNTTDCVNSKNL